MSALWFPYTLRVRRPWRKALALSAEKPGLLLRLADREGHVGWGELAPLAAVHGARREDRVLGEVARPARATAEVGALAACTDVAELAAALDAAPWARHPAVRFAVEMAWLGLASRRAAAGPDLPGRPARRAVVPVNALVLAAPDHVEAFLATPDAATWPAVKVKVGRRGATTEREALQVLLAGLAPDVVVRLDANRAWSLDEARARLEGLPLERLGSIEEPLADPRELAAFHEATGLRIALDETLREPDHADLLAAPFVEAWIVKPAAVGVAATWRLDARARDAGKRLVVTSCLESGLGLAFLARLAAGLEAATGAAGLATQAIYRADPLVEGALVQAGHIEVARCPDAPAAAWLDDAATLVPCLHRARPPLGPGAGRVPAWPATQRPPVIALVGLPPDLLLATLARAGRPEAPFVPLVLDPRLPAAQRTASLVAAGAAWVADPTGVVAGPAPRDLPDARIGTLLRTSGSSGQGRLVAHAWAQHRDAACAALDLLEPPPGARWLLSLGLAHVGGLALVHRAGLGDLDLCLPAPGERLEDALARLRPEIVSLVPTQLLRLLDGGTALPYLARMHAILLGGAAAPRALRERAVAAGLPIVATYGTTETTAFVVASRDPGEVRRDGVAGRVLPGREVRVDDDGGIHVRTPTLALGTLGEGGLAPLADADGWYATGDRGRLEGDLLVVLGRADRMFVSGGVNVHPEAAEAVLASWPGIDEVAVLGVPDPEWGARAVAVVRGPWLPPVATLAARAREELAPAERPRAWFAWPDDLRPGAKVPYGALAARLAGGNGLRPLP
jgi:O-succinylbenzoic acid--CoA ligase